MTTKKKVLTKQSLSYEIFLEDLNNPWVIRKKTSDDDRDDGVAHNDSVVVQAPCGAKTSLCQEEWTALKAAIDEVFKSLK